MSSEFINSNGSSTESINPKKAVLPSLLTNAPTMSQPQGLVLRKYASASTPLEDLDLDAAYQLRKELQDLFDSSERLAEKLQANIQILRDMIKKEFDVDNVHEWAREQQEKKSVVSKPPVVRIKLATQASDAHHPGKAANQGRGTGSKNLSRMNRPAEKGLDHKPWIPNQTPIHVFWNYIESYFKPIEEADLKYLDDPARVIDPTPFTIPPLGKHYTEQWKERYGYQSEHLGSHKRPHTHLEGNCPTYSLRDRLLAMLIEESLVVPEHSPSSENTMDMDSNVDADHSAEMVAPISNNDFIRVDERIRQELVSMGFEEFAHMKDYQEDDPICMEVRTLQRMLREQVCINHYRKKRLAEAAKSALAAQEFYSLLNDVNKQIEHLYHKRIRQSKKKRKTNGVSSPGPAEITPDAIRVLETKARLIEGFKDIIPPLIQVLTGNSVKLFSPQEEEQVVQIAKETGSWLPMPEGIPLQHFKLNTSVKPVFPIIASEEQQ